MRRRGSKLQKQQQQQQQQQQQKLPQRSGSLSLSVSSSSLPSIAANKGRRPSSYISAPIAGSTRRLPGSYSQNDVLLHSASVSAYALTNGIQATDPGVSVSTELVGLGILSSARGAGVTSPATSSVSSTNLITALPAPTIALGDVGVAASPDRSASLSNASGRTGSLNPASGGGRVSRRGSGLKRLFSLGKRRSPASSNVPAPSLTGAAMSISGSSSRTVDSRLTAVRDGDARPSFSPFSLSSQPTAKFTGGLNPLLNGGGGGTDASSDGLAGTDADGDSQRDYPPSEVYVIGHASSASVPLPLNASSSSSAPITPTAYDSASIVFPALSTSDSDDGLGQLAIPLPEDEVDFPSAPPYPYTEPYRLSREGGSLSMSGRPGPGLSSLREASDDADVDEEGRLRRFSGDGQAWVTAAPTRAVGADSSRAPASYVRKHTSSLSSLPALFRRGSSAGTTSPSVSSTSAAPAGRLARSSTLQGLASGPYGRGYGQGRRPVRNFSLSLRYGEANGGDGRELDGQGSPMFADEDGLWSVLAGGDPGASMGDGRGTTKPAPSAAPAAAPNPASAPTSPAVLLPNEFKRPSSRDSATASITSGFRGVIQNPINGRTAGTFQSHRRPLSPASFSTAISGGSSHLLAAERVNSPLEELIQDLGGLRLPEGSEGETEEQEHVEEGEGKDGDGPGLKLAGKLDTVEGESGSGRVSAGSVRLPGLNTEGDEAYEEALYGDGLLDADIDYTRDVSDHDVFAPATELTSSASASRSASISHSLPPSVPASPSPSSGHRWAETRGTRRATKRSLTTFIDQIPFIDQTPGADGSDSTGEVGERGKERSGLADGQEWMEKPSFAGGGREEEEGVHADAPSPTVVGVPTANMVRVGSVDKLSHAPRLVSSQAVIDGPECEAEEGAGVDIQDGALATDVPTSVDEQDRPSEGSPRRHPLIIRPPHTPSRPALAESSPQPPSARSFASNQTTFSELERRRPALPHRVLSMSLASAAASSASLTIEDMEAELQRVEEALRSWPPIPGAAAESPSSRPVAGPDQLPVTPSRLSVPFTSTAMLSQFSTDSSVSASASFLPFPASPDDAGSERDHSRSRERSQSIGGRSSLSLSLSLSTAHLSRCTPDRHSAIAEAAFDLRRAISNVALNRDESEGDSEGDGGYAEEGDEGQVASAEDDSPLTPGSIPGTTSRRRSLPRLETETDIASSTSGRFSIIGATPPSVIASRAERRKTGVREAEEAYLRMRDLILETADAEGDLDAEADGEMWLFGPSHGAGEQLSPSPLPLEEEEARHESLSIGIGAEMLARTDSDSVAASGPDKSSEPVSPAIGKEGGVSVPVDEDTRAGVSAHAVGDNTPRPGSLALDDTSPRELDEINNGISDGSPGEIPVLEEPSEEVEGPSGLLAPTASDGTDAAPGPGAARSVSGSQSGEPTPRPPTMGRFLEPMSEGQAYRPSSRLSLPDVLEHSLPTSDSSTARSAVSTLQTPGYGRRSTIGSSPSTDSLHSFKSALESVVRSTSPVSSSVKTRLAVPPSSTDSASSIGGRQSRIEWTRSRSSSRSPTKRAPVFASQASASASAAREAPRLEHTIDSEDTVDEEPKTPIKAFKSLDPDRVQSGGAGASYERGSGWTSPRRLTGDKERSVKGKDQIPAYSSLRLSKTSWFPIRTDHETGPTQLVRSKSAIPASPSTALERANELLAREKASKRASLDSPFGRGSPRKTTLSFESSTLPADVDVVVPRKRANTVVSSASLRSLGARALGDSVGQTHSPLRPHFERAQSALSFSSAARLAHGQTSVIPLGLSRRWARSSLDEIGAGGLEEDDQYNWPASPTGRRVAPIRPLHLDDRIGTPSSAAMRGVHRPSFSEDLRASNGSGDGRSLESASTASSATIVALQRRHELECEALLDALSESQALVTELRSKNNDLEAELKREVADNLMLRRALAEEAEERRRRDEEAEKSSSEGESSERVLILMDLIRDLKARLRSEARELDAMKDEKRVLERRLELGALKRASGEMGFAEEEEALRGEAGKLEDQSAGSPNGSYRHQADLDDLEEEDVFLSPSTVSTVRGGTFGSSRRFPSSQNFGNLDSIADTENGDSVSDTSVDNEPSSEPVRRAKRSIGHSRNASDGSFSALGLAVGHGGRHDIMSMDLDTAVDAVASLPLSSSSTDDEADAGERVESPNATGREARLAVRREEEQEQRAELDDEDDTLRVPPLPTSPRRPTAGVASKVPFHPAVSSSRGTPRKTSVPRRDYTPSTPAESCPSPSTNTTSSPTGSFVARFGYHRPVERQSLTAAWESSTRRHEKKGSRGQLQQGQQQGEDLGLEPMDEKLFADMEGDD